MSSLLSELTRKGDGAQCAATPLTNLSPSIPVSIALGRRNLQEKGWNTFFRVRGGRSRNWDGSSFVPVSFGRLALEPKPRQPASPQEPWSLEASPLTWSFVVFKGLKGCNSNSSPLLGIYHVPGASHAVSQSVLKSTLGVDIIIFLQMKRSSFRKVTSPN